MLWPIHFHSKATFVGFLSYMRGFSLLSKRGNLYLSITALLRVCGISYRNIVLLPMTWCNVVIGDRMLPSLLVGLNPDLNGLKEKYLLARISLLPLMHILDYPDHLWNNHPAPVLLLWSFLF